MRFRHNSRDAEDTGNGKHSGGSAAASDSNIQRRHALCRRGVTILEVQVITTADLKAQTRRELADLARNYGVPGWHGLKKDELVTEIRKVQRRLRHKASAQKTKTSGATTKKKRAPGKVKATRAGSESKAKATSKSPSASTSKGRKTTAKRSTKTSNSVNRPMPKLPEPKISAKTARIRAETVDLSAY